MHRPVSRWLAGAAVALACASIEPAGASAQALQISDYATMPMTGRIEGTGNDGSLARVNFLRAEPGPAGRLFVNDLNGLLYILDQDTRKFVTYLDFNGSGARTGLFDKLTVENGYANGLISFQFDPDYARNGRFYTIHLEDPEMPGSLVPDGAATPGLSVQGYTPTAPIATPGEIDREAVVIEWTDSNIANTTFEGSARELMRVQLNTRIHPMGDLIFNPTARPGDPEWRVLYLACGDGGSGEQKTAMRLNPQRLDTLVGKILRIVPDLAEHVETSTVSGNGRYRVPRDNPFAATAGARKEIWAYGFRNPHRLSWDVDAASPANSRLIAAVIGLHAWETVDLVRMGGNYGYSQREGPQRLNDDNSRGDLPEVDMLPVHVTDTILDGMVAPQYPVIAYPHAAGGGDAIAGGFVYRGSVIPALRGKYIFGDITTGHVWYADYAEMVAADDGKPATLAQKHELQIEWDNPADTPDAGRTLYPTMSPIVEAAYHLRGGKDPDMPGTSTVSGPKRVDMRFAVDGAGELYILSKSDGMIRAVTGATLTAPSARN
ncbi:MAG: PQQ-dependent sugar dehydrogenase [Acidobacteriota bacterium]